MKTKISAVVVAMATVGASACDGVDESGIAGEDEVAVDENVGTAEQALLDNCATGSNPNFTSLVSIPFTSDAYQRTANFINPSGGSQDCGPSPRATTIVQVTPSSFNTHRYRFFVGATMGPVGTTKATCETMQLKVRFQKRVGTTNVDIDPVIDAHGIWVPGFGCIAPPSQWEVTRLNKSGSTTETNRYTVNAFARKANGTFGTVIMTDENLGP